MEAQASCHPIGHQPPQDSTVQEVAEIALHSCGLSAIPFPGGSSTLNQVQASSPTASTEVHLQHFLEAALGVRDSLAHLRTEMDQWVATYRNRSADQWQRLHTGLSALFQVPQISENKYSDTVNKELRVLLQLSLYINFLKDQSNSTSAFGQFATALGDLKEQLAQTTCYMRGILAELTDDEVRAYVTAHASPHVVVEVSRYRDYVKRRVMYVAIDNMMTTFNALKISLVDGCVEIQT